MTRPVFFTASSAAALILFALAMPMQAQAQDRQIVVEGKDQTIEADARFDKKKKLKTFVRVQDEAAPADEPKDNSVEVAKDLGSNASEQTQFPAELKVADEPAPEKPKKLFKLKVQDEPAPPEIEVTETKKLKVLDEPVDTNSTPSDDEQDFADAEVEAEPVLPPKKLKPKVKVLKKLPPVAETEEEPTDEEKTELSEEDTDAEIVTEKPRKKKYYELDEPVVKYTEKPSKRKYYELESAEELALKAAHKRLKRKHYEAETSVEESNDEYSYEPTDYNSSGYGASCNNKSYSY